MNNMSRGGGGIAYFNNRIYIYRETIKSTTFVNYVETSILQIFINKILNYLTFLLAVITCISQVPLLVISMVR